MNKKLIYFAVYENIFVCGVQYIFVFRKRVGFRVRDVGCISRMNVALYKLQMFCSYKCGESMGLRI